MKQLVPPICSGRPAIALVEINARLLLAGLVLGNLYIKYQRNAALMRTVNMLFSIYKVIFRKNALLLRNDEIVLGYQLSI